MAAMFALTDACSSGECPMVASASIPHLEGMNFTREVTALVDASAAAAFQLITDIEQLPEWNAEIVRVVEARPVLGVGAEWVVEINALGRHWNSRSTVTEIDPEKRRFAYRSRSDDGNPSHADWRWQVTEDEMGTRVRVSVEATPRTFWRKHLASRLRPRGLQRAMQQSLRALDAHLAAEHAR